LKINNLNKDVCSTKSSRVSYGGHQKWLSFRIKVQSSWIFIFQKINTWLGLKENMPDKFTSDINPTLNPNEL
jgi:hypothetical protein